MSNNTDPNFALNMQMIVNAEQSKLIVAKIESQTILKDRAAQQQQYHPVAGSEMRWQDAERIKALEHGSEVNARRRQVAEEMLTLPLNEIANKNMIFREKYKQLQIFIADWMVSEKAFRELAIDLGIKSGLTKDEVVNAAVKNKEKILNNESVHGNNAKDHSLSAFYTETLKERLKII